VIGAYQGNTTTLAAKHIGREGLPVFSRQPPLSCILIILAYPRMIAAPKLHSLLLRS